MCIRDRTYCLTAESARELATSPAWCPPIPSATANRLPDSRTASSFISRTFPVCVIEAELQWYICIPYFSPASPGRDFRGPKRPASNGKLEDHLAYLYAVPFPELYRVGAVSYTHLR